MKWNRDEIEVDEEVGVGGALRIASARCLSFFVDRLARWVPSPLSMDHYPVPSTVRGPSAHSHSCGAGRHNK